MVPTLFIVSEFVLPPGVPGVWRTTPMSKEGAIAFLNEECPLGVTSEEVSSGKGPYVSAIKDEAKAAEIESVLTFPIPVNRQVVASLSPGTSFLVCSGDSFLYDDSPGNESSFSVRWDFLLVEYLG